MKQSIWTFYVSFGIAVLLIVFAVWYARQYREDQVLRILAAYEPDRGIPVYGQFHVQQVFEVHNPIEVTRLSIPMFVPSFSALPYMLKVQLHRNGHSIESWDIESRTLPAGAVRDLILVLHPPVLLDGNLALTISAPDVAAADYDAAPRIFVESADDAYPEGHFSVAGRDKKGDVSFTLYGRSTRFSYYFGRMLQEPTRYISVLGRLMLGAVVIVSLPYVVRSWFFGASL